MMKNKICFIFLISTFVFVSDALSLEPSEAKTAGVYLQDEEIRKEFEVMRDDGEIAKGREEMIGACSSSFLGKTEGLCECYATGINKLSDEELFFNIMYTFELIDNRQFANIWTDTPAGKIKNSCENQIQSKE